MSFGNVRSLVGISFHSFAPILENDFRSISSFQIEVLLQPLDKIRVPSKVIP